MCIPVCCLDGLFSIFKPKKNDCDCAGPIPSISPLLSTERLSIPCMPHPSAHILATDGIRLSQDVALAALYVSTKEHDTLKKPRELLAVSYSVRFPELAAKSKHPGGEVDLDTMDQAVRVSDSYKDLNNWRFI